MPPIPPPRSSGYTTTTDVPLYWARYGSDGAPPLLLLHGGPGADHEYLLPQMLELGDHFDLVLYDQRGGGRSKTDDRTPITWRSHVADLAAIVREFDPTPLTLVGYSWGGLLAMLYSIEAARGAAVSAPDRLVLIDPAPITREFRRVFEAEFLRRQATAQVVQLREALATSGLRDRDPAAYKQRAFELSVAGYFADPAAAHDLTPFRVTGRVQESVWESLGEYDLTGPGELDLVSTPALVIHGREDPIPLQSSETVAEILHAELVVIDGSGHVPYVERPKMLFAPIRSFLDRTR